MLAINFLKVFLTLVPVVLLSLQTTNAIAAPEIPKAVEQVADKHYFRQEAISLLYDKKHDYVNAFNCLNVMDSVSGPRIDVICTSADTNVLTLSMVLENNAYPIYVMVCPAGFDDLDPFKIAQYAFIIEPTEFNGDKGTSHYMGRSNGWIKDFENIFLTADLGFVKSSCWALNKR